MQHTRIEFQAVSKRHEMTFTFDVLTGLPSCGVFRPPGGGKLTLACGFVFDLCSSEINEALHLQATRLFKAEFRLANPGRLW